MPEKMTDQEWRDLILTEVRDLRKEFNDFRLQVVSDQGEKRGSSKTITAVISAAVSFVIAIVAAYFRSKPN